MEDPDKAGSLVAPVASGNALPVGSVVDVDAAVGSLPVVVDVGCGACSFLVVDQGGQVAAGTVACTHSGVACLDAYLDSLDCPVAASGEKKFFFVKLIIFTIKF